MMPVILREDAPTYHRADHPEPQGESSRRLFAEQELTAAWLLGRLPAELIAPWVLVSAGRAGRGAGRDVREAAFALGAQQSEVITQVTLQASKAGIMTGVLLAVARIAGETAPLMFTALSNQFWSLNLNEPMANLPVTIFKFAMSPFTDWQQLAWAGVFLITVGVYALNIAARYFFRDEIQR